MTKRNRHQDGIELRNGGKSFSGSGAVLQGIDLFINSGEFVVLLGPSGCGKSTLLRILAGLEVLDQGELWVGDFASNRGFVFQESHLLPWLTALENIRLPLELMKNLKPLEIELRAREALARVGLGGAAEKYPAELSGGMKMRVSLARALVTKPKLLLLDEPFAALDEMTRFRLQEDLRALWQQEDMTIVFVTHSVSEAVFIGDRAIVLKSPSSREGWPGGPARVVLDHLIALPEGRSSEVRMSLPYVQEIGLISGVLRDGTEIVGEVRG